MSSLQMLVSSPFRLTYSSWVPMIPATLDDSVSLGYRPSTRPLLRRALACSRVTGLPFYTRSSMKTVSRSISGSEESSRVYASFMTLL